MDGTHIPMPTVDQLAEIAMESEITDPIDWGLLVVSEKHAYKMMASYVLEMAEAQKDNKHFETILMATITKLLVENFVLNLKVNTK
jgi:hypothetical protein